MSGREIMRDRLRKKKIQRLFVGRRGCFTFLLNRFSFSQQNSMFYLIIAFSHIPLVHIHIYRNRLYVRVFKTNECFVTARVQMMFVETLSLFEYIIRTRAVCLLLLFFIFFFSDNCLMQRMIIQRGRNSK